jgi:hypothetical protein
MAKIKLNTRGAADMGGSGRHAHGSRDAQIGRPAADVRPVFGS